jgi:uncharacterized protein (TIGR03000 family)
VYTLILMTAMATSTETPSFFFRHAACHGYFYVGCHGYAHSHRFGCYGACDGYYFRSHCYGCYGGLCYGCLGSCYGCTGFTYGSFTGLGYGVFSGGGYFGFGPVAPSSLCMGCSGCYGCFGGYGTYLYQYGSSYTPGAPVVPGVPVMPGMPSQPTQPTNPEPIPAPGKIEDKKMAAARIILEVPESANVYVDGNLIRSKNTSSRRTFSTPALEPGQAYYYMIKVEVQIDGKTYSDEQRVIVNAGQTVESSFAHVGRRASDPVVARPRLTD